MLTRYIVIEINNWKSGSVIRRSRIGWRSGDAIPKHVWDDYEILCWIQSFAFANHSFVVSVLPSKKSWKDNHIILGRSQPPVSLVGQSSPAQRLSRLEVQIAYLENFVVLVASRHISTSDCRIDPL